jgi:hypothetical protein
MGYYDTAQICKRGHVITGYYNTYPDFRNAFCEKCGEATITQCPACGTAIRGGYHHDGPVMGAAYRTAPGYCHACGKPFPWTELKLQAAQELIGELDGLNEEDRNLLKQSLDELITDSPKTEVASLRFKRIMKKVGKESYETVKAVVTDLLSESIKKTLFNP